MESRVVRAALPESMPGHSACVARRCKFQPATSVAPLARSRLLAAPHPQPLLHGAMQRAPITQAGPCVGCKRHKRGSKGPCGQSAAEQAAGLKAAPLLPATMSGMASRSGDAAAGELLCAFPMGRSDRPATAFRRPAGVPGATRAPDGANDTVRTRTPRSNKNLMLSSNGVAAFDTPHKTKDMWLRPSATRQDA